MLGKIVGSKHSLIILKTQSFGVVVLSTNIALWRGGIWNYSVVFNSCPASHVSTATISQESKTSRFPILISLGNRDPTWELIWQVCDCRENIFGHFISRLVQVTGYPFFKTSESSCILCVIPCSSLLRSTLFLVAFSSGDFKIRESVLTVTKFLWKSDVNRNTDGLKENIQARQM